MAYVTLIYLPRSWLCSPKIGLGSSHINVKFLENITYIVSIVMRYAVFLTNNGLYDLDLLADVVVTWSHD